MPGVSVFMRYREPHGPGPLCPFWQRPALPSPVYPNHRNPFSGKGQGWSSVRNLLQDVDPEWAEKHCSYSLASGEGLVRLASEHDVDTRLFLILPEMSILLNSSNRQGSNLSGYLRQGYDRLPLENQRAKEGGSCKGLLTERRGTDYPSRATGNHAQRREREASVQAEGMSARRLRQTIPRYPAGCSILLSPLSPIGPAQTREDQTGLSQIMNPDPCRIRINSGWKWVRIPHWSPKVG